MPIADAVLSSPPPIYAYRRRRFRAALPRSMPIADAVLSSPPPIYAYRRRRFEQALPRSTPIAAKAAIGLKGPWAQVAPPRPQLASRGPRPK